MRRSIKIIVVLSLAIGLSACAAQEPTPTVPENIILQWWGTVHSEEVMKPLIEEYQSQNSNIKIDYSTVRWNKNSPSRTAAEQYRVELDSKLTSDNINTIPDIFSIDSTWVGAYEKFLSPAPSDVYSAESFKSTFWPVVSTNFVTSDQKILGIPDYIDVLGLVYNSNMLAASDPSARIPSSWNDFRALARTLTKRGTGSAIVQSGFAGGFGKNVEFAPETFLLLALLNGSTLTDITGNVVFASGDSLATSLTALDFYKSFVSDANKTWVDDPTYYVNDSAAFIEQKVASIIVPSWRYRQLEKINQDQKLNIDIKVAKTPQLAGNDPKYWATYFGNVVAQQRPYASEAWKFLSWLTQPAQLKKLSENTAKQQGIFGLLYPRADMAADMASDQYLSVFSEMLPNAQSWAAVDGLKVNGFIRDMLDQTSSDNALKSAESQISSLVKNKDSLIKSP